MSVTTRLREFSWLFVLWFAVAGLGLIGGFIQFWRLQQLPLIIESAGPPVSDQPRLSVDLTSLPKLSAGKIWVFERNSRSLLYEQHAQEATSVASLAKLMTALVAYETFDVETPLKVGSSAAVLGNRAKFFPSDSFLVADLLKAMLIFSANDAADVLAHSHSQGRAGFVDAMNEKTRDLQLKNTNFANSYGIDDPLQYSTAEDIGTIADVVLNIPLLADTVSQTTATIREQRTGRLDTVYTTNSLLYKHPKFRGMKTGTTELAGESLVVRLVHDDFASMSATLATTSALLRPQKVDVLMVILGSQDRYADALALTKWIETTLRDNSPFSQP